MTIVDPPTRVLGRLGASGANGWGLEDTTEHVADLQWPLSVTTYSKMRNDPTIRSVLAAYTHPIMRAPWHIDPRGASPAIVQVVADSLGLPVLGQPDEPGPVRNRHVRWRRHLRLALQQLVFGHYGFEPVYAYTDGRVVLTDLPERLPSTITRIETDDTGQLKAIYQSRDWVAGQAGASSLTDVPIPASNLLWYVHDREGDAWYGQSMFRPCFGHWLLKQDTVRVQATGIRRWSAGIPVMEPLPGTNPTPAQVTEAARMAQNARASDGAGAATPGFTLRIKGVEGTLPDAQPFLRYLDEQMARAALASVLDLGSTPNGSRALGGTFADLLAMAQQAVAEAVAETATELAVRLTDFNEGDTAAAPAIVVGDVAASRRVLAESVAELVKAGAVTLDAGLERWVRDSFDLPERAGPALGATSPPPPGQEVAQEDDVAAHEVAARPRPVAAANRGRGMAAQPTDWPYRRQLTAVEAKAGVDPISIDTDAAEILGDLLRAWKDVTAAWSTALLGQVDALVDAGDLDGLSAMALDVDDATAAVLAALVAAAAAGAGHAAAEATAQGQAAPAGAADHDALAVAARAPARTLAAGVALSAGREALRLAGPGQDGAAVADGVAAHLGGLTDAAAKDVLGGSIAGGMNAGRAAVFTAAAGGASFYASEIRDSNTCKPCRDIDGTRFESLADAEAHYRTGGYTGCAGRFRCRGIIVARWDDES